MGRAANGAEGFVPVVTPGVSQFLEASDGIRLHYLRWSSQVDRPSAVVVFLHGVASHAAWFNETAVVLSAHGVAVYGPDRRGSGLSGGRRGHLARFERAISDLDEILEMVRLLHPETPVFLAASSWAAKLGVVYATDRSAGLAGLMLLGPGLLPTVDLSLPRRVAVAVGHVVAPTARIAIPLTPEQYTATPRYRDLIGNDRLRLLAATTRFFWETLRLDRRRERASASLDLPLLVLQGEDDAMMNVPKTYAWFSQLPDIDKTYKAYPGAGHTLDFDLVVNQYRADMLDWLSARAPGGA
jgi:alpha-beta hydrolase superfamily lysophospholipase